MEENKYSLELTIQKLNILSSSNVLSSDYKQVINRAVDLLIEQHELIADLTVGFIEQAQKEMIYKMGEITVEDINKAIEKLKEIEVEPSELVMSTRMKEKIIKMLHEHGIGTKGEDGEDYILGRKVIIDDRLSSNIVYIR